MSQVRANSSPELVAASSSRPIERPDDLTLEGSFIIYHEFSFLFFFLLDLEINIKKLIMFLCSLICKNITST